MAEYSWNPRQMRDVFVLPSGAVDNLLTLATVEQWRVLLWFSRQRQGFDADACAGATGLTPDVCKGCLDFWVQQGVLLVDNTVSATAPEPVAKTPSARPTAVKPMWQEVVAYQKEHQEFTAFLQEVSARLGRPLNHGDNATLLYLITTAGIPSASVLMTVGYAVSVGKANVRYVESLALAWADEDIVTPDQVDNKIRQLQEVRTSAEKVEKVLGLTRALNAAQAKTAHKWLSDWSFSDTMLQHAQTITNENCAKFSVAYMDKILERWHAEGISCPDHIAATPKPAKKKGVAATNPEESSLDSDAFEAQLLKYRPKFNKK